MNDHTARVSALSDEKRALLTRRLATLRREASGPVPLPRHEGVHTFPTSLAQERLWFLEQLVPGNAAYNVAGAFSVTGPLELPALRASLERLVARHESLRTTFVASEGRPLQVVSPRGPLSMTVTDLDAETTAPDVHVAVAREVERPFDLARGPLLRVRVFRLPDGTQIVCLTMHHLVADAWSVRIFVREIATLYREHVLGLAPTLPALPLQYADYAAWQRNHHAGHADARAEALAAYWRRQLEDAPYPAVADADRLAFRGAARTRAIAAPVAAGLRDLARREGVTIFVVTLAAWKVLLMTWSGQDDVTVLAPVANRERSELAGIVGFFVNLVALRTDLSGDPPFRGLLGRVNDVVRAALRHQELPFELVLKALGIERTLMRPPLSPFAFALERDVGDTVDLPAVTTSSLPLETTTSKTDLALSVREHADGLSIRLEYNRDLYEPAVIADRLGAVADCLERAVDDPDARLSALACARRARPIAIAERAGTTVWMRFATQSRQTPAAVAVRGPDGAVTYERLAAGARRVAARLAAAGVEREAIVAVWSARGAAWMRAILGIWARGAVYLPLDPRWPAARIRAVLRASRAAVVLVDRVPPPSLRGLDGDEPPRLLSFASEEDTDAPAAGAVDAAGARDLAYVIYTSGSTGTPKGALIEHAGLRNHLDAKIALLGLGANDRVAQTAAASFDISLWQGLAPLLVGGTVEILDEETVRDPVALRTAIRARAITVLELVPAVVQLLLDADEAATRALGRLRWLVVTGEALPPELCRRWLARYPTIPLVNAYGPTECADDVTHHVVRTPPSTGAVRMPIGRPIAGMTVHVLDERLRPVADGEAGELCIGGIGVGRGYLHDAERTAAAFVTPDPFVGGVRTRLYRTGDRGRRRPDGMLEWLGRLDAQVKIRGVRVEPAEVEAVLSTHPDVRHAAVLVSPADAPGQSRASAQVQLIAYVAVGDATVDHEAALRTFVAERLPAAMVPSRFVLLATLPLTPNGKIDRRALVEASFPPSDAPRTGRAPTTAAECLLAELWHAVLGRAVGSIDEGFFALGGDSLASIRLVAAARRHGLVFTPQQVFEHQTIAALAAVARAAAEPVTEQGLVMGDVDLTPIQRMLLAADLPDLHHYNMTMLLASEVRLEPAGLAVAVEHLLRHHDALRLRMRRDGSRWLPRFAELDGPVPYAHVDLAALADAEAAAAIETAAADFQTSLDLARGPIVRVVSFDLGAERPSRLLLIVHHLACDAASWPILLEDLVAVYDQVRDGAPITLPAKTTSYRTWARRLAEHAGAGDRRRELDFWRSECAELGARVPREHARAHASVADVTSLSLGLAPDETRRMLAAAAAAGVTVEAVLATALATALIEASGVDTLLVFLERHGREPLFGDVDVSRTVGWFTAVFPVCLRLGADRSPLATLTLVDRHLREIPDGGIGWGVLGYGSDQTNTTASAAAWHGLPRPEVSCNYLGRIDPPLPPGWSIAPESAGRDIGRRGTRPTVLDVIAYLADGRLHVAWHYDGTLHHGATIAERAARCLAVIRELADALTGAVAAEALQLGRTA